MSRARERAEQLRRARERAGLTPELLDDLAGLARGSVEAYELTQRVATGPALHDLAQALGIPARELVEEAD